MRLSSFFSEKAVVPNFVASTFNKYPARRVKPYGLPGNVWLAIGATVLITTVSSIIGSGMIPHTKYVWYGVKDLKIDLSRPTKE